MAFDLKQIVAKVAAADATGKGQYIAAGDYLLKIKKAQIKEGFSGTNYICEFEVLESKKTEAGTDPNLPGATVAFIKSLSDPKRVQMSMNDIKGLIQGCTNTNAKTCTDDVITAFLDGANEKAIVGTLVRCSAVSTKTKAGGNFTVMNFSPAEQKQ